MEKRNFQVHEKNHHISEALEAEKLTCAPSTWEGKDGGSQYTEGSRTDRPPMMGWSPQDAPGFWLLCRRCYKGRVDWRLRDQLKVSLAVGLCSDYLTSLNLRSLICGVHLGLSLHPDNVAMSIQCPELV